MTDLIESYCGMECSACEHRSLEGCGGCLASGGNPYYGECEIAICTKEKGKRFCGECGEFPCDIINRHSNSFERGDSGRRIERCKAIKAALVKQARQGVHPVGVCGHHCDYCFLGQWCGGCRGDYNCCSYAAIYKDGICENVKCSREKSLNGCYQCGELPRCEKGYYGKKNEYIAKASALFIKKHGEACYTASLKRAIDAGENYPKAFDASGSVENALRLLEKYLNAESK